MSILAALLAGSANARRNESTLGLLQLHRSHGRGPEIPQGCPQGAQGAQTGDGQPNYWLGYQAPVRQGVQGVGPQSTTGAGNSNPQGPIGTQAHAVFGTQGANKPEPLLGPQGPVGQSGSTMPPGPSGSPGVPFPGDCDLPFCHPVL